MNKEEIRQHLSNKANREIAHWLSRNQLIVTRRYNDNGTITVGRNEITIIREYKGSVDLQIAIFVDDVPAGVQIIDNGIIPPHHLRVRPPVK